ncbi:MAG: ParB/RepB/Spo0J family partition protein [Peptococcaceae bacterium]|jgi:ParB family chromosome partitioning protein|nr:ParB/RepB/Spo0J family partition protein [Peptococcaceae bacterium]MDH7524427.1 ParB/RepB/Spo0J family partition protein [Peptococcaceae bacterium]
MEIREKGRIQSFKDIFGDETKEAEGVKELPLSTLQPYENHPFKLYSGERFDDIVRSVKELGVIVPIIVRPKGEEKYEILSGHNRVNAAKTAGLQTIPAVIKDKLTDEEAALIVTETNLMQRSFADLCHSERAIALAMHHKTLKKQGARTDLINELEKLLNPHEIRGNRTSSQVETRLTSLGKTGIKYSLSRPTVARYLRLNELIPELLARVDKEEIAFIPAVALSYLRENEQRDVEAIMAENGFKVDMSKAEILRSYSEAGKLDKDIVYSVLAGELDKKKKSDKPVAFKLKAKLVAKFFSSGQKQAEIEEIIEKALILYFEKKKEAKSEG